jgi:membrane protein implicated in regulation of membrane protease activity
MGTLFLICAAVGGVILLCQFVLMLIGMGGDHDISVEHHIEIGGHHAGDTHVEHGSTWYFHVLSLRSLIAAVTFFGLAGLAVSSSPVFSWLSLPIALVAGALAMVVVAWLMALLHSLQAEGNVRIERAVGAMGTVYLTIPEAGQGAGKVTVKLQNRTMEYRAVTAEKAPLNTGMPVIVVGISGPDTVEVGPAPEVNG